jgi:predicted nuclease of predicted toxin-antitoxin system
MAFSLLLDEMTEAALAEYCEKLGHDVERVVDSPDLVAGSDDTTIVAYAEREHRLLVTYDDDFLGGHDALDRIGVLFQVNDRTLPFETANIIDSVSEHIDQQQVVKSRNPVHLTTEWL